LENCSNNPNHQVDNDGLEEFVLNLNLSGLSVSNLAGLGFGAQLNSDAANLGQGASRDIPIPPSGTFVNKMLFGSRLGHDNDYFKITSMAGDTHTTIVATPEPSSVILLGTIGLAALHLMRKRARRA
jgi:hypothetical protein